MKEEEVPGPERNDYRQCSFLNRILAYNINVSFASYDSTGTDCRTMSVNLRLTMGIVSMIKKYRDIIRKEIS